MMELLEEKNGKFVLCEKSKMGDTFNFKVLTRMESQALFRSLIQKPAMPMERLMLPPEDTGSVSDPLTEKWCNKKHNLENDFTATAFNFVLNNT